MHSKVYINVSVYKVFAIGIVGVGNACFAIVFLVFWELLLGTNVETIMVDFTRKAQYELGKVEYELGKV